MSNEEYINKILEMIKEMTLLLNDEELKEMYIKTKISYEIVKEFKGEDNENE